MAHRGKTSMRKFKKRLKGGGKKRMSKSDWAEISGILGPGGGGPGVRKRAGNPSPKKVIIRNAKSVSLTKLPGGGVKVRVVRKKRR